MGAESAFGRNREESQVVHISWSSWSPLGHLGIAGSCPCEEVALPNGWHASSCGWFPFDGQHLAWRRNSCWGCLAWFVGGLPGTSTTSPGRIRLGLEAPSRNVSCVDVFHSKAL